MLQTATLSGDKVDWPMVAYAVPAVPKIAGGRKMLGYARLPKGHKQVNRVLMQPHWRQEREVE
jgi:hypothetical protein